MQSISESWQIKPYFECDHTFSINWLPNGILFSAKSIGKVSLQSKFGLVYPGMFSWYVEKIILLFVFIFILFIIIFVLKEMLLFKKKVSFLFGNQTGI